MPQVKGDGTVGLMEVLQWRRAQGSIRSVQVVKSIVVECWFCLVSAASREGKIMKSLYTIIFTIIMLSSLRTSAEHNNQRVINPDANREAIATVQCNGFFMKLNDSRTSLR